MRLNLNQCSYWKYNFMWNEKSTAISIGIYDDNWQIWKEVNGKRLNCILKLVSSDEDITDYVKDMYEEFNINELIDMVDITNYLEEYLYFIEIYNENKDDIIHNHFKKMKQDIDIKIKRLEDKKKSIDNIEVEDIIIPSKLKRDMLYIKGQAEVSLSDYVEWSDTYIKKEKEKIKYKDRYNNIARRIWYDILK